MWARTAAGATAPRLVRASAKVTSDRPSVATIHAVCIWRPWQWTRHTGT
jgi:hypothetical protein